MLRPQQNINYSLPGLGSGSLDYVLKWKELEDVLTASGELNYTGNCVNNSLSPALFHGDAQDGDVGCPYNRFNPILLNEIVLPDNTSYVFTYNVYGELDKIVYPTGAYERFAYDVVNGSSYVSNPYSQANRGVVDRWVSASGSPSDEVHSAFESSVGSTTITAPDGSYTVRTYQIAASGSSYGYEDKGAGSLLEEKAYDSNDNLLGRILFEYQLDGPYSRQFDPRVTHKLSIVFENGESSALATMSKVEYATPGSGGAPSDWSYFAKLNAVKTTNYNYLPVTLSTAQTGSLSTLKGLFNSSGEIAGINETDFLYDSNYNERNIRGLTTESRVKDANGNIKARMQISYDESYYQTTTSGATPSAATGSWIDLTAAGELGPTIGAKRGRATSAKSYYDISNGYYIETHTFHDQFGNTTKSRDGLGTDVTISFDDDYAFAYPTSVTTPIPDSSGTYGSDAAFTNSTTYDYNTGRPLTSTDANGQTSTMEYADSLLRPTKVTAPNGQQTISEYGAGTNASTRWVRVRTQIDETRWKEAVSWFDALGRGIRSQNIDPESGDLFSLTCYDNMGRVAKATNPFRGYTTQDCTTTSGLEWTTNTYDAAGRPWKATTPDGAFVETLYSLSTSGEIGTVVTVKDQALKERRSITNAIGQLKRVDEPSGTLGLGAITAPYQPTSYAYDLLNNLTTVTQIGDTTAECGGASSCTQSRSFTYDALSRLKSAVNPESGTINYTYDANNNLATKTDARGITTNYTYDRLNRVTERSYAVPSPTPSPSQYQNSPTVNYYYDNITNGKGKLKKVTSSVSTTEYTGFDILGRVTASKQTTNGVEYGGSGSPAAMTYTYNLGGAMVEQQYPSGRVVKNTLDATGDLSMVTSKESSSAIYKTYVNDFTYSAAGAVTSLKLGNGKFESTQFNSRLQPTQIALGASVGDTSSLKLDYEYGATAAVNNGNVTKQTITVPGLAYPFVQTYTYDSLNRLDDANETYNSTQTWRQDFSYDRYGNRNFVESNTSFAGFDKLCNSNTELCATLRKQLNPGINSGNNNRMNSGQDYTYDSAGNTLTDANGQTFIYDGENKQVEVRNSSNAAIGKYWYDGDGKRVKKEVPGTGEVTIFVYDAAGKQIAEYSTVVASANDAKVAYLTADHLGSPRINTDVTGAVTSRHDYHPFGEEIATAQRTTALGYSGDTVRKQFTAYERDIESSLDFAEARMYNFQHGRFTSTDPIIMSFKRALDPQRINLYAYSRNNPLKYIDPDGEDIQEPTGLSEEDQKAYEKWKAAYLATEAGRKTWERYQNDKNFTLNIVVADRGSDSKNRSAMVGDFKFDSDGNFIGSTMTLGRNLGKDLPGNTESYPVLSALDTQDSAKIGASKIAHEFGHLDDLKSLGTTFYEQQKILDAIKDRVTELGSQKRYGELGTDPTLKNLNDSFQKKFGVTTTQEGINRENRGEKQAIPTIRQIFGNSLPDKAKKAMNKLERGN
ncbi:MAG: RHS repeat-associated core domain-containing protein [Chloracidobacterium sp.]|nr:RHS repeat-associated core domain-containing protein [Chloracidobacterium sp.]